MLTHIIFLCRQSVQKTGYGAANIYVCIERPLDGICNVPYDEHVLAVGVFLCN